MAWNYLSSEVIATGWDWYSLLKGIWFTLHRQMLQDVLFCFSAIFSQKTNKLAISTFQESIEFPVSNNYLVICVYWVLVYTVQVLWSICLFFARSSNQEQSWKEHHRGVFSCHRLHLTCNICLLTYYFGRYFLILLSICQQNCYELYRFVCCSPGFSIWFLHHCYSWGFEILIIYGIT